MPQTGSLPAQERRDANKKKARPSQKDRTYYFLIMIVAVMMIIMVIMMVMVMNHVSITLVILFKKLLIFNLIHFLQLLYSLQGMGVIFIDFQNAAVKIKGLGKIS